jgi:hypothetical protein
VATGVYVYTATITDAAGKTFQTSATTTIDVSAPSVAIASPGPNDQLLGSAFNPSGSASDIGTAGVSTVEYRIDVDNDGAFSGTGFEAWTPASGTTSWNTSIDFDTDGAGADTGLGEGEHELFVRATDGANNVGTVQSVVFFVDQAAPTLTETSVGTVSSFANSGFSIGGNATDSNQLSSITVTQSKDGGAAVQIYGDAGLTGTSTAWSTGAGLLPRDPATPSNYLLSTGEYTYVITLTDAANRTSQLTRTVTVDTTPPTVTFTDPIPGIFTADLFGPGLDGYTVNGTVSLKGNVTDNQSVATLTTKVGAQAAQTETNKYSFSRSIDTTDEATYGFTAPSNLVVEVVATDAAGNTTSESYTMYVDQASDAPTFELTNLDETVNAAGNAGDNLLEFNAEVIGTASDDDSVDAAGVRIQVDLNGDDDYLDLYDLNGDGDTTDPYEDEGVYSLVSTPPGADGSQVTFRHDLTSLPEGTHKMRLQIADINGTTTTTPDIYFVIDKSVPAIENISPANGSGANSDFSIAGTFSDSSGLKDLNADGASTPDIEWGTDGVTYTAVDAESGWTTTSAAFSIPITAADYGEGTQNFYLRATDIYGKTNVVQIQILIDTVGPTLSYTYPESGASLNGLATVRGTASDTNQVSSVEYSLDGGTTWTGVTSDKYSWSFSFDTRSSADGGNPGLTQGPFTVKTRAVDSAGNSSGEQDLALVLDQSSDFPTVDLINMDETITTSGAASGNLQESNAKVQGTITDDDWVDASTLQISIDGGAYTTVSSVGSSSTSVAFEHPLSSLTDGVHSLSFRVSDTNDGANDRKGGLPAVETTSTDVYFALDKSNPTVVVTPPSNTYTTGPFSMSGTVTDGNIVDQIVVSTDGGTTFASTGVTFTSGSGVSGLPWSWSGDLSAKPEGPFTLKVKGIDEFGKESIADLVITVDKTGPIMDISTPSASETVNGPVNLSGTGSETYGFDRVEFALDIDGNGVFTDTGDTDWTPATGTFAWHFELDSTTKTDATYDLYVRGIDEAGNVSAAPAVRSFTIDQSSDAPIIELATLDAAGAAVDNLLPSSLQISGTASDDDSVENTSLQIRIDENNDGDFGDGGLEDWDAITGRPSIDSNVATWSHTFSGLSDGAYRFEMRAGDVNFGGNYGDAFKAVVLGPVDFSIDTALPTGSVTTPAQGAFVSDPGTGVITISGTASDASGVQSVEISVDGAAAVGAVGTDSWSYDYTISGDGQVSYQVIITDTYGKVFTIDRYLTVDTVAPVASYTQPAPSETVNGSLLIRGTTDEINQVSEVYLWLGADGAMVPGDPAAGDFTGWTPLSGTFNWSHRVNTTLWSDGTYDVHVRAVDNAGNISSDSVLDNLVFDQSTDLPEITLSSLSSAPTTNLFTTGGVISGSVVDDDTVDASSIEISFDGGTNWTTVTNPGTDSGNVSFSHDLSGQAESGSAYDVRVRASDIGDTANGVPVQTTTTASYVVAVDRSVPSVAPSELSYSDRYTSAPISITGGAMSGALINNNFTLVTAASDPSGIGLVEVSTNSGAYQAATDNGDGTWSVDVPIDVSGNSDDGTLSFTVRATDTWGRENTTSLSVVVDTTEPTVSYLEPGDGANVNGTVTVRGTSFDAGAFDSITITGGRANAPDSPVVFANAGTIGSWTTTFDATIYDNVTYATDNGDGTWGFPLRVTVYDAAGNRTEAVRTANLDPEGDKPVVVDSTLQPADGSSVAGTIVLQSTVTDDDSPAFVRVYADVNDDGDYGDAFAYDLTGDGDTTDPFETEGSYLEVAVSNGTWTALVNEGSQFGIDTMIARGVPSPTGFMRFFIVPYDVNGLAGNAVSRRIYIDATSPEILNLNHANAETVKGTISLTGTIRDDATMTGDRMKISFDGGTTYQNITIDSGPTDLGDGYQTYTFDETIDTTTYFAGDSGNLDIAVQVTDQTFKQSNLSLTFNVDNARPAIAFNDPETLPYVGTPPTETYSFYGNNESATAQNQLYGSATDSGLVSGIAKVNVYFVKDGNFESPKSAVAPTPTTTASVYNQSGTLDVIPFTESSDYVITIDNRIEQGQFDQTTDVGDFDGFQESLRAKVGYDEWYAFFDTTVLPDGPFDIYFVAYDEAGNTSYGVVDAQSANYPPTVESVTIGAGTVDDTNDRVKVVGAQTFTVTAVDSGANAGIAVADFAMNVTNKYAVDTGGAIGAEDTGFTPIAYGSSGTPFDSTSPTSGTGTPATATIDIDTTTYESGFWYRFEARAGDADGNVAQRAFYVWVNNNDTAAPVVTINEFSQSSVASTAGHVEEATNSPDGDADLSGTVTVSGTVYDDTSVSSLTIAASYDSGSTWTDLTTISAFGTPVSGDAINGYTYNWSYSWNTADVAGFARENVIVRARGLDGTNTTAEVNRPTRSVDVVPYITDITGAGFDSGLLTYVKRSASGAYPVAVGDTITITGYNLPGTAAGSVRIGTTDLTPISGTVDSIEVDLGATATSGEVTVTTNSVTSRNNSNSASAQNLEPSPYNANLTDDRTIVFWDVSALSGTSTVTDATMQPNYGSTGFDWMYVRGGKSLWALPDAGGEIKLTEGTGLSGGSFTYNEDGRFVFLYNHDAQWTFVNNSYAFTGSLQYGLIPDLSTFAFTPDQDEAYNWNNSLGFVKLGVGNVSFTDSTETLPFTDYGYNNLDLNRYENLKLRTVGNGTVGNDAVNRNYVAYFDSGADESRSIVFYAFQTGTAAGSVAATSALYQNENQVTDVRLNTDGTSWYANLDKYYETNNENDTVALAGTQSKNDSGIATPRGRQEVTTANSGDDSADFDLGVYVVNDTTHYGFIAYFDESVDGRSLKITANESLYTADPTGTLGTWTPAQTIDSAGGSDVAMAVGADGTIHLAYQSASGYLKYANVTYDSAATGDKFTVGNQVFVDALFGAGTHNSVSLRTFGAGDVRPVITTFSSAYTGTTGALRMSYPLSDPATVGAGADETTGAFSGAWETVALPSVSTPEAEPMFLFTTSSGDPHVGYRAATLEEATFLGF